MWSRRRWDEGGVLDACVLPEGHQVRKVLRIGEKSEDQFEWVREPLPGVVGVAHVCQRYRVVKEIGGGWCFAEIRRIQR